jgi:nucleoside phosphorylase/CheY-like chemotaxis protein
LIKVLIAEDNPQKAQKIKLELISQGVSENNITISSSGVATRTLLRSESFSLLLLDLALPNREQDNPSPEVGLEILRLIVDDQEYPSPIAILGTTADQESLEKYHDQFLELITQILFITPTDNEWKVSIRNTIGRLMQAENTAKPHVIDVCYITALREPELAAILKLPIAWGDELSMGNGILVQEGYATVNGKKLSFICAHSPHMGLVAASFMTRALWERYRPKVIMMTGICGGLGNAQLGDVVVAERSWDWQSGKWLHDGSFSSSPDQKEATPELIALARGTLGDAENFWRNSEIRPANKPKLHIAPMVSGSAVVEDPELHARFFSQHRKAIAVDMECYGVYFSASMSGSPAPKFICIKSVSDLANRDKSDNFQEFCSELSASISFKIIERLDFS